MRKVFEGSGGMSLGKIRCAIRRYGFLRYMEIQRRKFAFRECWFLAIREKQPGKFWEDQKAFQLIVPPQGGCYADPCLVKKNGINYLFFEEYKAKSGKGTIACVTIDSSGACSKPETVLERNYHLSYPHIFEWQGDMYMVPESVSNRTIELYRATKFPHQWELIKVLMTDIKAADTTLYLHLGQCWMFTNIADTPDAEPDKLCLFTSQSPLGPWRAHRRNPIVSDASRSRPAGALFFNNGHLIRPSQDCSRDYGQAMWLNRITLLSNDDYNEVPIARINPGLLEGDIRTHTLSQNEDWEIRDGFWWIGKWRGLNHRAVPPRSNPGPHRFVGNEMESRHVADRTNANQKSLDTDLSAIVCSGQANDSRSKY
jgi:hypothetical protein